MSTLCPFAIQKPITNHSWPGTLAQRHLIVLHCTSGPTAISAWWSSYNSVAPHRTSFHFVIDRDGSIWQIVPLEDTTWHASQVNSVSVGVEHAGSKDLPCTPEQYASSIKLVTWLCQTLKIPADQYHIQPHSVASPADGHLGCCGDALDYNQVITGVKAALL
jgi:N-acetyl-anhydromuramyl-L-alanine amidase AmpD